MRPVRRADNPTTLVCRLSGNPGALTSRISQGHVGLFRGYITFHLTILILSSHLRLGLPCRLFPSGFPTKTLYCPHTCYMPRPPRLDENPLVLVPSCNKFVQRMERFAMRLSDRKYLCQEPFINDLLWRTGILSSIWKLHWHKKWWVGRSIRLGKI
jgi:hypothetical protein